MFDSKFYLYLQIVFITNLMCSLIATQKRLVSSLSQSAEERYSELINACPDTLPQRIPQHMLASYLGITPETLSRIRRQMSVKKTQNTRDLPAKLSPKLQRSKAGQASKVQE